MVQAPKPQISGESTIPPGLLDFIREGEKFLIAGHKEPDGDCVGSQIVLASVLQKLGKETILCSAGPFKRSEIKQYENLFYSAPEGNWGSDFRVILVDCSSLERTGDISKYLEGRPMAVIDHHEAGDFANNTFFIEENATAATVLVLKLILALGLQPDREEAGFLFLGLCTDTGFFRHVDENGAETFEVAAALIRAGANPKAAYSAIYGGKSFDSRRSMGHVLARTESLFDGKLLLSSEDYDDVCRFGLDGRDSDSMYQLLQTVEGMEAIVFIRQETPEKCAVGFRSRSSVDVGSIAMSFGGGGHKNAAGVSIPGTVAEIRQKIIDIFEKIFI